MSVYNNHRSQTMTQLPITEEVPDNIFSLMDHRPTEGTLKTTLLPLSPAPASFFPWSCMDAQPVYVLFFLSAITPCNSLPSRSMSPRAHLHMVGMLQFLSDINQPGLPTSFYSVPVFTSVYMALSTVFHSINPLDNSQFSDCSSGLISSLLVLSTMYLFMKVSLALI